MYRELDDQSKPATRAQPDPDAPCPCACGEPAPQEDAAPVGNKTIDDQTRYWDING